jgi:hypothetical protein
MTGSAATIHFTVELKTFTSDWLAHFLGFETLLKRGKQLSATFGGSVQIREMHQPIG